MKKFFTKSQSGFTLIELLVVIAIIAILSTIVLASLGAARQRARDTRASSEISSMRAQGELYYNDHGLSYGTAGTDCNQSDNLFRSADPSSLASLLTSLEANQYVPVCATNGDAWQVNTTLKNGKIFCSDSTGFAGEVASAPSGNSCQ
jgi:prepilin-type N-terminal cleavage/methylation domain-containing protein